MDWLQFAQQPQSVQLKAMKRAAMLGCNVDMLAVLAADVNTCLAHSMYSLVDLLLRHPVYHLLSKVTQAVDRNVLQAFSGLMMAVPDKVVKHVIEQLWTSDQFNTHHRTLLAQAMPQVAQMQACLQHLAEVSQWGWHPAKNDLLQTLSKADCTPISPQQPSWVWRCLAAAQGPEMHGSIKFGKLLQQTMVRHSKCWPLEDVAIRALVHGHTSFMKKALAKALPNR
jgi:hypothetical protein